VVIGAVGTGSFPGGATQSVTNYTIPRLLEEHPLESRVRVAGNVSTVLDDYRSEAGNVYQQFYLAGGGERVKVFCSTANGRVNISTAEEVTVTGTFQEFYGQVEIYTRCASISAE
ncbi:MAG: hypothetical protein SVW77_01195, partial [Candidatus Nanohaloarchaea archaeon]|nr:hypothetical protein [Candidatus Nanohaloarchaea archaeon]